MYSWTESLRSGFVHQYDGVGISARGDLLIAVYGADASLPRSVWLFGAAEKLITQSGRSIQALLIVPPGTKPPDSATRDAESAAYRRFGSKLRRVVAVPEGGGFRVSVVRMVFYAHAAVTGSPRTFMLAKDLNEAVGLLHQTGTDRTPSAEQIAADIINVRAELNKSRC